MENTTAQTAVKRAIDIVGCSPAAFAKKSGVSQNAVWKLLKGITKAAKPSTAQGMSNTVNGEVSVLEFMGIEQGANKEGTHENGTDNHQPETANSRTGKTYSTETAAKHEQAA